MSLPVFATPRDFCIYLEKHDYNLGSKIFMQVTNNRNAGLLLEELVTRLCRSRKVKDDAVKKHDGKVWLEISDLQLKRDCFLTPGEIRTARQYLQRKGFIEVSGNVDLVRYSINGNSLIEAFNKTLANSFPPAPPFQETTPTDFSLGSTNTFSNYSNYTLPPIVPPPARGTRIPENFSLTSEMRMWGKKNHPDLDLDDVTEAFIDYWKSVPGARAIKLDWEATWRNWVRNTWRNTRTMKNDSGKLKQPRSGWFTDETVRFIN